MHYGIGSSQCQRRGLIRPQGDLWAALRAAGSYDKRTMRERSVDAADEGGTGPRKSLLSRFLLPQGNSVDDRRKRLFTEREIQMLFRHRQRELRSPLQPLREI